LLQIKKDRLCIFTAKLNVMNKFYSLNIKEIIRETEQAVSLSFEVPDNLKELFSFKAGQYITLKTNIEGKEVRRAYSLCSAPNTNEYKVTVKEVEGGTFSVLANNKLKGWRRFRSASTRRKVYF